MIRPPTDWASIATRAGTLAERLRDVAAPGSPADDATFQALCRGVASGDPARLARFMAWEGLDDDLLRRALAARPPAPEEALPEWTGLIRDALAGDCEHPRDGALRRDDAPVPFEDLLFPVVRAARARLEADPGAGYPLLAERARADLERSLLVHLSSVCDQTLNLEFSVARARMQAEAGSGCAYERYVEAMRAGGFESLCARYPVLARLVATRAAFWVEASREFCDRLGRDLPRVAAALGIGADPGRVAGVEAGLSDSHRRGRTVMILRFETGARVVYKPRSMALDRAYGALLEWLNDGRVEVALRAVRVVECGTHGWAEFAGAAPCADADELARYHRRAGMLVCLSYVLGASDLHCGNVIACGEHPVLVDLEVLMGARITAGTPADEAAEQDRRDLWHSVVRTCLLPQRVALTGGGAVGVGGFASAEGEATPLRRQWVAVNTAWMRVREEPAPAAAPLNAPTVNGVAASPAAHLDEILRGFRQMYDALARHRDAILAPGGPLAAFRGCEVRVVLRSTHGYAAVVRRGTHPRFLDSGVLRSVELDVYRRWALRSSRRDPFWPVMGAEREDMEALDIPLFVTRADSVHLHHWTGEPLGPFAERSGWDTTADRLRALDPADRRRQAALIHASFRAQESRHARAGAAARPAQDARAAAVDEARQVAALLERVAQPGRRSLRWTGFVHTPQEGRGGLRDVGVALNDGAAGIALLFAALWRATGEGEYRTLAGRTLRPLEAALRTPAGAARLSAALGVGGGSGTGGVVYALTRLAGLLERPELLEAARRAALGATPAAVAADGRLDVSVGCAGTLLGALALHGATGDAAALALATACGDRLLEARTRTPGGERAWAGTRARPGTGFAHGASGIGLALLRLSRATGRGEYHDAALEGWAFERRAFHPGAGNWLEEPAAPGTEPDTHALWCTWCRGAAGIGLARVAGAELAGHAAVAGEIDAAVAAARSHPLDRSDHLCCGNLGRAELLWTAGERLGNAELRGAAHDLAAAVVARARTRQAYGVSFDGAFTPGLMQGMAGIGYQLLRLHHPDLLPSVLLWD